MLRMRLRRHRLRLLYNTLQCDVRLSGESLSTRISKCCLDDHMDVMMLLDTENGRMEALSPAEGEDK